MLRGVQGLETIALDACGLARRYGKRWAVAGVNVRLEKGRSLLVAGHNGAGKTTLLRLLATTLQPTLGSLAVEGIDPRVHPLRSRRKVAMLAQRNGHYLELSAIDNLRIAQRLMGMGRNDKQALSLLKRVALEDRAEERVRHFSAGMKKRLAFAKVLLKDSPIVLLDEPYGQLDPAGIEFVDQLTRQLLVAQKTVVMVTHLVERASSLLERGLLLDQGEMKWVGEAANLPSLMKNGA